MSALTEQMVQSGEKLLKEVDLSDIEVEAALWFYFEDQSAWKLLISVKGIEKSGPRNLYNKLQKIISKAELSESLPLSELALVKPKSPLLGLLRSMIVTGSGISGIRFTGNVINGQLIPDAYIYRIL